MNQLTPQHIEQAMNLRQEGYSIRDIAQELGVPKGQIEKLLVQQSAITIAQTMNRQSPATDQPVTSVQPTMANLTEDQRQVEIERNRLAQKARQLADFEQDLLRQSTTFNISTAQHSEDIERLAKGIAALAQEQAAFDQQQAGQQQLLQSMPGQQHVYEMVRKVIRQDKLVKRYNRLFQELIENCDDCRWSGDEVDDYLEQVEAWKAKFVAYCEANQIDRHELLMFKGINFLIDEIEEEIEDQTTGIFQNSSVTFDYSEEYQAKLKRYMVETFDQMVPTLATDGPISPAKLDLDDDDDLDDDE